MGDFDHTYMDRSRPKGPDYLIMDKFDSTFLDLTTDDLMKFRSEAELISDKVCQLNGEANKSRCDNLVWFKNY